MSPAQEAAIIDRLAAVHAAVKSFDAIPNWDVVADRNNNRLVIHAAIRLDGKLGGGVFVRISTPQGAWDRDIYGQIEVQKPTRGAWRIDPVEWEPLKPHTNGRTAPSKHRLVTLTNRIHPFALNRRYGLSVFDQKESSVAVDFPRAISRFEEYLDLCSEVWNFPELKDLSPPKWTKLLL